jgi:serine phosphatase RsbU (regulator of sigma subunit)
MEEAAKRYARKILLLHLLALVVIVCGVALAARGVYGRARGQVIEQAREKQMLLAGQTARGIENHYGAIFSNLDLIRRGDADGDGKTDPKPGEGRPPGRPDGPDRRMPRTPLIFAPMLWHQLEDRVDHLFSVSPKDGRVTGSFPSRAEKLKQATGVAGEAKDWIASVQVDREKLSTLRQVGNEWAHLACVAVPSPGSPEGRVVLVAVTPARIVKERYVDGLNAEGSVRAILVDQRGFAIAGPKGIEAGHNMLAESADPARREIIRTFGNSDGHTDLVDAKRVDDKTYPARMLTAMPIEIADRQWLLLVESDLAHVEGMVNSVFKNAFYWSAFLVLAMTALLVSSSTHMIRSRLKIEKLKNELMSRELQEARKIQLAWLPSHCDGMGVDIAAVNEPASHVSGDFYDWFELPDGRTVITIGDVTGHGMSAAFLMATTQLLIRNTIMRVKDPGQCLTEVNRQLCGQIFNGQFVTVMVVVLDPCSGIMQASTAGHYPPLLSDGERMVPIKMDPQLVLGVDEDEVYVTEPVFLPEQYTLVMYTDGVLDVASPDGQRYGMRRLREAFTGGGPSARAVVESLRRNIRDFCDGVEFGDDVTLVAVQGQAVTAPTRAAVAQA